MNRGLTCILFFLLGVLSLNAQFPDLRFSHITAEQGLSNNEIISIGQDKEGFIWMGTLDGLNKFDGYEIRVYKHNADSTSLISNFISQLLIDSHNLIWVSTNNGISVYNRDQDNFNNLRVYKGVDEQNNNFVTSMVEDSKGIVIVANDRGSIFQYNRQSNNFSTLGHKIIPSITSLSLFNDTLIFVGTRAGLFSYNRRNNEIKSIKVISPQQDKSLNITCMVILGQKLYIGTIGKGVQIINLINGETDNLNKILQIVGDGSTRIYHLYVDDLKNLWISDAEGIKLCNLKNDTYQRYGHNPNSSYSLNTDGGAAIFIDHQQNKWFGTALGGVNVAYERKKFFNLKPEKEEGTINLSKSIVSAVIKDKDDNLCLGYYNEGIDIINLSKKIKVNFSPDEHRVGTIGHSTVQTIYQDSKGDLWVGLYTSGLERFDKRSRTFKKFLNEPGNPNSIAGNDIRSITEDKHGNLWMIVHGVGIDRLDLKTGKFHHLTIDPKSLMNNWNFKLMIDSYDTIWIAGSAGLCKLNSDGEVIQFFNSIPGNNASLSNKFVNEIFEDSRKNLWIGTYEGLNYLDRRSYKITKITVEDGLLNDNIKSIVEDKKGNIWVSTNKGISKVKPFFHHTSELDSFYIRNYDERDGIESNAFFERAGYLDSKTGEIYFGGLKGLTYFMPDSIKDNPVKPSVIFTDFKLFYRSVSFLDKNSPLKKHISETKVIRLKYSQNVITFDYTALNFINPGKNQFAYIMEGFDKKWNYVGSEHKATYTNLDPGEYTFRVKASNNDGLWNTDGTSVKIIIAPYFWKSKWSFIIYLVILSLIGYFLQRLITFRQNVKNQVSLAKLEAQKMHEVNELKINFFTQISHEFRTPLTLIISPIEKLIKLNDDNVATQNYYTLIYKNAQRLKRLINELLDFRKNEEGFLKLEATNDDIIVFIKGIAGAFNDLAAQRNMKYTFSSATNSLFTWFDPDKLDKILFNLIANAFKYTPDEGEIAITVDDVDNKFDNQENIQNFLRIKIKDSGVGIPADLLEKIFLLFYQVEGNKQREGTGIGLALTKELVKLHKGKLSVESELGKGSCFTVLIPIGYEHLDNDQMVAKSTNLDEKVAAISVESITFNDRLPIVDADTSLINKPLALIVDDNIDLRSYLSCELFTTYKVVVASDGEEGFNRATELMPDIIISDVMMPGMNGIEFCHMLKTDQRTSHIPVVLLTARSSEEHRMEGYHTGADDYITKPFSVEMLMVRIKNLIDSRRKLRELFGNGSNFTPKKIAVNPVDEMFLNKAIAIINENMSEYNFDPSELASKLGLSRSQLYRKINALTNTSVSDFVNTIRLNKAAEMLLEHKYTISEVAFAVGFSEQSNFTRSFHKQFGQSPTAFIAGKKVKEK